MSEGHDDEIREVVRDMARAQTDFYGVVYTELSALREQTARVAERVEGLSGRIDGLVMDGAKMTAVVRVLEAAEDRRIERARLAIVAAKLLAWTLGIISTLFGVATAIAHWGAK